MSAFSRTQPSACGPRAVAEEECIQSPASSETRHGEDEDEGEGEAEEEEEEYEDEDGDEDELQSIEGKHEEEKRERQEEEERAAQAVSSSERMPTSRETASTSATLGTASSDSPTLATPSSNGSNQDIDVSQVKPTPALDDHVPASVDEGQLIRSLTSTTQQISLALTTVPVGTGSVLTTDSTESSPTSLLLLTSPTYSGVSGPVGQRPLSSILAMTPLPHNSEDDPTPSLSQLNQQIKTKSIEQTLIPLVTQITTLVNAREKPIKTGKQLRAIVRVGQAVNLAVERFVQVGEAMADDNPEIRLDMYDACKDARAAGAMIEQLCDIGPESESGHLRSYADKSGMVRAARALLSSVTRVLLLADTVVVKQLLSAKDRVSISLNRLENVANFTEFVKAFSVFGSEMVELAHLTGDRQNDLKDERRRAQMATARQLLERSTMMLLTSSKACLRHPDCETARENRDTVFIQMRRAMDLIHFVVKDGVLPELAAAAAASIDTHLNRRNHRQGHVSRYQSDRPSHSASSLSDWNVEDYDQCLTAHNAIKRYDDLVEMSRMTLCGAVFRERLLSALDTVVERTQDFTDSAYTSHEHREKMLLLCDRSRLELNQLLRVGVCLDQAGSTTPTEDFESAIVQTARASNELKHHLQITALDQAEELFKLTDEIDIVNKLKNCSMAGDHDRLEEYAESFSEHADHVQEVCKLLHHVATNETLQIGSKNCEASLCVYGPQTLNASHTLCVHPTSKIAKENLEVFIDLWITLYSDVHQLSREVAELLRSSDRYFPFKPSRPSKSVTIQETPPNTSQAVQQPQSSFAGPNVPSTKPAKPLDSEEQAKIAKTGLEMKMAASEVDAEADKWPDAEDNDIVRRAKAMSQMAFSMYQFTRGEGDLKTTQDLFTQAEFFAEEANKFYKIVRHFSYQVTSGPLKKELLEHLDKVPTFVQQLQFTVKNATVGKAATFTKVDNVIQETKNLMTYISKTVTSCLTCGSKYNLDMGVRARSRTLSPSGRYGEDEGGYDGGAGMGSKGGTSTSDPNI